MGFSEAVRTCLKLKYATFQGRASRSEFWWFFLFNFLVVTAIFGLQILMVGTDALFALQNSGTLPMAYKVLFGIQIIFSLAIFIPSIAVSVRRFHDRNLSGWWYLATIVLFFIPLVNLIVLIAVLIIYILKGTEGPNKFGRDPLGTEHSADVFN